MLETTRLDSAGPTYCYGASIALTPGQFVHVGWIRGQNVIYRQRSNSGWSDTVRISTPSTEPASNPSLEAYGDSVFCVWHGPNSSGGSPGDIWRRSRWLSWQPQQWFLLPSNQSERNPNCESDYPVMTTSFVTLWHEQVSEGNWDIWGRFLVGAGPQPFFEDTTHFALSTRGRALGAEYCTVPVQRGLD